MKSLMALAVLAMLPLFLVVNRKAPPTESPRREEARETVLALQDGDWRKDAATDCLEQMLTSNWEGGTTNLGRILKAAGFELTKVTVKEVKQSPSRIRFGFEFDNREQVKTLYWEADCRVEEPEPDRKLASR